MYNFRDYGRGGKDMKTDIDKRRLLKKIKEVFRKNRSYASFVFFICILLIYTFLVYQISQLTLSEPSEAEVTQQVQSAGRIRIDQQSLDKIQQLQDQNVQVQSLFESARDNPFKDD